MTPSLLPAERTPRPPQLMGALDETLNLAVRVSQRALVGLAVLIMAPHALHLSPLIA